jgi:pantothenate kinase
MDRVWFVSSEEAQRVERLVARHVEFGKSPDAAKAWVAGTDQSNAELVSPTAGTADLVVVNGSDGWLISPRRRFGRE